MHMIKLDNPLPGDYHIHVCFIYHCHALTNSLMDELISQVDLKTRADESLISYEQITEERVHKNIWKRE